MAPCRTWLACLACFISIAPAPAWGDCPGLGDETVHWVVPNVPGGGYDLYSRLIQPFLEERLNTRVIIENRPEAGGLVAAIKVRDARPDGRTIGIVNASGLMAAGVLPDSPAPDLLRDFTILARIVSNQTLLFSASNSEINNIEDLLQVSAQRPIVVGVRDIGSASFLALPIAADLLGLDYATVTGYVGSTSRALAVQRGDVDLIIQNFDSVSRFVESGELLPLLQISGKDSGHPILGGEQGMAARLAIKRGTDPGLAKQQADGLSSVMAAGRIIVAPARLPVEMQRCISKALAETLSSPELQQAAALARLSLAPTGARETLADLRAGDEQLSGFEPLVRAAMEQARQ